MIRSFDASGAVVCWDSHRVARQPVVDAFTSVGFSKLVPKANELVAVTDAAKCVAGNVGMIGKDQYGNDLPRLKYFTLDRSAVGVGVYQEIRGKKQNEYRFMFSAGLDENTNQPHILHIDPSCPFGRVFTYDSSVLLRSSYYDAVDFLPASDLTRAVNTLVKKSHGVLLKDNGGTFFLPGDFIARYSQVADAIEPHGPKLHVWTVDLTSNPKLVETVNDRMQTELVARIDARQAEWDALVAAGGKPRTDGLKSRYEAMVEDARQIEYYEQFFSTKLDELRAALEKQQSAIGMAHLDLWNAEGVTA